MTEEDLDPGADTETFRAFAQQEEPSGNAMGVLFRILTVLIGLLAFGLVAWLLVRF